jgi:hypothetical protein
MAEGGTGFSAPRAMGCSPGERLGNDWRGADIVDGKVGATQPLLPPHQQKEARERIAAGETQRGIARSYNVSQATISRL